MKDKTEEPKKEKDSILKIEYQGRYWHLYKYNNDPDEDYQVSCFGPTIVWGCAYPQALRVLDVLEGELHDVQRKIKRLDRANRGSQNFLVRVQRELMNEIIKYKSLKTNPNEKTK